MRYKLLHNQIQPAKINVLDCIRESPLFMQVDTILGISRDKDERRIVLTMSIGLYKDIFNCETIQETF